MRPSRWLLIVIASLFMLACQDRAAVQEAYEEDADAEVTDVPGTPDVPDTSTPRPDTSRLDVSDTSLPDVPDTSTPPEDVAIDAPEDVEADADAITSTEVCGGGTLQLSGESLVFEELPTGAIRFGLSGYDPETRACVIAVLEGFGPERGHCGDGPNTLDIAIYLFTDINGPCRDMFWSGEENGAVALERIEGCFSSDGAPWNPYDGPLLAEAVMHTTWTDAEGTARPCAISFDNTATFDPPAVLFGFEHSSDIPEDVFVQRDGGEGGPAWLRVLQGGGTAGDLFNRHGLPTCDGEAPPEWGQQPSVSSVTYGDFSGGAYQTWDGHFFSLDAAAGCVSRVPASPGLYTLEVCYGYQTQDANPGQVVSNPTCETLDFQYPSDAPVIIRVSNGG